MDIICPLKLLSFISKIKPFDVTLILKIYAKNYESITTHHFLLFYIPSAKKFKSVYENKTKDVEKYLESKQKTLADAQSLVEEGEEAWKKDELEKVKVCLSKISSFPQFAIELRKSYETYETTLFVVSKYCENISKIQKLLLDYESDSKYNSRYRDFELSGQINNTIDTLLRCSKLQDFYKYQKRNLELYVNIGEAAKIIDWALFTQKSSAGSETTEIRCLEWNKLDFYDLPIEKWNDKQKMVHLMIHGDDHQLPNKYKLTRKWAEMEKLGKEILSHVSKIDNCFHYSTPKILDRISSSKKDLVKSVKLLPELCTKELITELNSSGELNNNHIDLHSLQKLLAVSGKKPLTQKELDAEEKQKREKEKQESEKEKETPYAGCGCLILLAVIIYIIIESCSS